MPPPNKRHRHARNFKRKTDGSFWQLTLNKNLPARQPTTDEARIGVSGAPAGSGLFSRPQARRGRAETLDDVERLYAKRWVHDLEFYLVHCTVQWVGYRELTWEPAKNIPCRLKIDIELATINFVWMYEAT